MKSALPIISISGALNQGTERYPRLLRRAFITSDNLTTTVRQFFATPMNNETDMVLVVEDNRPMQRTLQRLFESDALQVRIASDGITGLETFRKQAPDVVVLDLKLPGMSGKDLCREFKTISASVPIVVLSADTEVEDKVLMLELGADDYVTKPFSPKELLARVRRAMRRTKETAHSPAPVASAPAFVETNKHDVYAFGDVTVNFTSMEAVRAGEAVTLTTQEFKLLKFFSRFPGRVLSRDELLNQVWGYENYPTTRTVDNHVLRLRQKLEADPANPHHFQTIHGAGYKFIPGDLVADASK